MRLGICLGGGGGGMLGQVVMCVKVHSLSPSYFAGLTTALAANGLSLIPFSIQGLLCTFDEIVWRISFRPVIKDLLLY